MITLYTLADAERAIARGLHLLRGFDTVVGVPRSGQVFAAFIATQLGVALADVATAGRSIRVAKHGHIVEEPLGRVLLVDDIVRSGAALEGARSVLQQTHPDVLKRVTTCCVWSNPKATAQADVVLGGDHAEDYAFTWQMWHSNRWPRWGTDMDGVLCDDAPPETADDEELYREWCRTAPAKWLPRTKNPKNKVGAIITSRPEGVRDITTDWLHRHGVRFSELVMVPVATQAEVRPYLKGRAETRATWKACEATLRNFEMFVESHDKDARILSNRFGGLVWCTDSQTRYQGGGSL